MDIWSLTKSTIQSLFNVSHKCSHGHDHKSKQEADVCDTMEKTKRDREHGLEKRKMDLKEREMKLAEQKLEREESKKSSVCVLF